MLVVFLSFNKKNNSIYNLNDKEFYLKVTNIKVDDKKIVLNLEGDESLIGTYYYKSADEIIDVTYGDVVYIKGTLKEPSKNTVPYAFNYKKYLENHDIYYLLSISEIRVVKKNSGLFTLKNKINKRISEIDQTGYMKAFILGDKSLIDDEDYSTYQNIGITHLFAISGMHIGLLSEILLKLFKKLRMDLKYAIIDILLLCYGFIVCFPSSVKRCLLFYIINSINKVFNLNLDNKKVLFLTVILLIIVNYKIIYDVGFLFSICTVGGIVLCNDFINDNNKFKSFIKLSLIAFLFSLPVSLYSFYQINLLSIIYNVLFVPYISLLVYPLSLLTFIFPIFNKLFSFTISLLELFAQFFSNFKVFNLYLSFNILEVCLFYLLLYLIFIKQQKAIICCLFLIVIIDLIMPYFDSNSYLYFLDVKQGDATLYVSRNRKEVTLIDTGGVTDSNYLVSDSYISMMKYLGINRIDNLIITHGDFDHMGDAFNVINNFRIDKVFFNCGEYNDLENELIKVLDKKRINYYSCISELKIDNNKMYFLQTRNYDNENDNSNVIYMKINDYDILLMADAEKDKEKDIISTYELPKIDILKVGHHGSKTSSTKSFIDVIEPKYSIISVGKYNKYGHPNKEVLNNLKKSKIYRTDQEGSIVFRIKNSGLKVDVFNS